MFPQVSGQFQSFYGVPTQTTSCENRRLRLWWCLFTQI